MFIIMCSSFGINVVIIWFINIWITLIRIFIFSRWYTYYLVALIIQRIILNRWIRFVCILKSRSFFLIRILKLWIGIRISCCFKGFCNYFIIWNIFIICWNILINIRFRYHWSFDWISNFSSVSRNFKKIIRWNSFINSLFNNPWW